MRVARCAFDNEKQVQIVVVVRTLVVTVSPLLAELVTSVLHPRLSVEVIGFLQTRDGLTEHLRATVPDLVLLGLVGTEADACARPLLAALPSGKFLVIAPNGQSAWLHEMRPHRTVLTELSVSTLTRALASRFSGAPLQRSS
jgi:DNA-binding NarL/FixJ family response regulator